jgi:hypothetical protein
MDKSKLVSMKNDWDKNKKIGEPDISFLNEQETNENVDILAKKLFLI